MQAIFDTVIPMPDDDALLGAPVRWRCGGVEFVVPLFTLPAFRIFDRLSRAIRFKLYAGDDEPMELSLQRVADLAEATDEIDVGEVLRASVSAWQDMHPGQPCPNGLAELICAFSSPVDTAKTVDVITKWYTDNGAVFKTDPNNAVEFRQHLAQWIEYNLPAEQVVTLVQQLLDVNTKVKKKLLNEPEPETLAEWDGKGLKPWPNLLQFTYQRPDTSPEST